MHSEKLMRYAGWLILCGAVILLLTQFHLWQQSGASFQVAGSGFLLGSWAPAVFYSRFAWFHLFWMPQAAVLLAPLCWGGILAIKGQLRHRLILFSIAMGALLLTGLIVTMFRIDLRYAQSWSETLGDGASLLIAIGSGILAYLRFNPRKAILFSNERNPSEIPKPVESVFSEYDRIGAQHPQGDITMTTIPDEKVLLQSGGLTLTTHRVRSEAERGGKMQITSIMLEELCSCEIRFTSNSLLLKLGGLLAALGIVIGIMSSDAFQHIFDLYDDAYVSWSQAILLLGVILVAIYFATRKEVISLASAAARINLQRRQSGQQEAKQLIDQIEAAKNQRYLLARAAANEA